MFILKIEALRPKDVKGLEKNWFYKGDINDFSVDHNCVVEITTNDGVDDITDISYSTDFINEKGCSVHAFYINKRHPKDGTGVAGKVVETFHCCAVHCNFSNDAMSTIFIFDGDGYMLNDNGQTIEKLNSGGGR